MRPCPFTVLTLSLTHTLVPTLTMELTITLAPTLTLTLLAHTTVPTLTLVPTLVCLCILPTLSPPVPTLTRSLPITSLMVPSLYPTAPTLYLAFILTSPEPYLTLSLPITGLMLPSLSPTAPTLSILTSPVPTLTLSLPSTGLMVPSPSLTAPSPSPTVPTLSPPVSTLTLSLPTTGLAPTVRSCPRPRSRMACLVPCRQLVRAFRCRTCSQGAPTRRSSSSFRSMAMSSRQSCTTPPALAARSPALSPSRTTWTLPTRSTDSMASIFAATICRCLTLAAARRAPGLTQDTQECLPCSALVPPSGLLLPMLVCGASLFCSLSFLFSLFCYFSSSMAFACIPVSSILHAFCMVFSKKIVSARSHLSSFHQVEVLL
eukprot:m.184979 g.184979  ORF g.184979 m.184979 type:complete len:374 (-) comp15395_c0_seq25:161-1282(-)